MHWIVSNFEPRAFNLEFEYCIPRFKKISLLCEEQCLEVQREVEG
jgi:hypothetical protein